MRLVIRKVQYAPEKPGPQPMVETTRSFLMSDRSLHLEASLDKEVRSIHHLSYFDVLRLSSSTNDNNHEFRSSAVNEMLLNQTSSVSPFPTVHCEQLYYHGEPISVNVHVTNNSTKTVKRVKISGESVRRSHVICRLSRPSRGSSSSFASCSEGTIRESHREQRSRSVNRREETLSVDPVDVSLCVCVSLQCVSMQTSASSVPPSINVQWPSWRQSKFPQFDLHPSSV